MKPNSKSQPYPMRHLSAWLTLCLALLLPSCATNSAATKPQVPDNAAACAALSPILVSGQDVLTDGTAKQVLAYDKVWKALCGKPAP